MNYVKFGAAAGRMLTEYVDQNRFMKVWFAADISLEESRRRRRRRLLLCPAR